MKSKTPKRFLLLIALVSAIVCGCGSSAVTSPESGTDPAAAGVITGTSPQNAEGRALYESKCAGCHGNIDATDLMTPVSFPDIRGAISANIGGMRVYAGMSDADLQMIADAVNTPSIQAPAPATPVQTGVTPPATLDGAAIYASRCAACHGAIASSNKIGTTIERVQSAIADNVGRMGSLSTMTAPEVQAVVAALNPAGSTPSAPLASTASISSPNQQDGAGLYSTNCAGCHGALGSSTKVGMTLARLQNATNGNVGGMGYLSQLTTAQQQAIVAVLTPTSPSPTPDPSPTPATDGSTLYSANCAGCHGVLASSGKAGATAGRIQNAISGNIGNMGYLSTLSTAQVAAIAAVLTTAVPPSPTDGPGLYATNCASCHRSLATSDVRGESANEISKAISKNKGGMRSLSSLTLGMITAIANALKEESDNVQW